MRKGLLLVFVLILAACTPKDENVAIVKKEFKNYIKKSFDDPNCFKEFVDIIPVDTISINSIHQFADNYINHAENRYKEIKRNDSIDQSKYDAVLQNMKKTGSVRKSNSVVTKFYSLLSEQSDLLMEKLPIGINYVLDISEIKKMSDSIKYYPPLFVYDVKYRIKENEGLKLNNKYAYLDSLNRTVVFSDITNDLNIINQDYRSLVKHCLDNNKLLDSYDSLQTLYSNSVDELNNLIQSLVR